MPPDDGTEVAERFAAAVDSLAEADALLKAGFLAPAIHVAYYAAFHAGRALVLTQGSRPKTHRGLVSEVGRLFVATGKMPREAGASLERVLDLRLRADYDASATASRDEAETALEAARTFVEAVRALLGR